MDSDDDDDNNSTKKRVLDVLGLRDVDRLDAAGNNNEVDLSIEENI